MFTKPWVKPPRRMTIGPADDYLMPIPCVDITSQHQLINTPEDTFFCNWCNKSSLYGEETEELTAPKAIRK